MKKHQNIIGRVVQVRFVVGRTSIAAVSSEFDKIAFIARGCKLPIVPQVGEEWRCWVCGDSNSADTSRGALFLVPMRKLVEEVAWTVGGEPQNAILGVQWPVVIRKVVLGNRSVKTECFAPKDATSIPEGCPQWLRAFLVKRFADLKEAASSVARSARQTALAELKRTVTLVGEASGGQGYPFQWVGDWLTNGEVWFPRQRPNGSEWQEYPVPAIPAECWELFLGGLAGKSLVELIPYRAQVIARGPRKEAALTARQKKVATLVATHMWSGNEECKRVSVGRNVIFIANRTNKQPVHIVDNPGKGALYIFDDYDRARALADGSVTRTNAIKAGVTRVIHLKNWQARVAKHLS